MREASLFVFGHFLHIVILAAKLLILELDLEKAVVLISSLFLDASLLLLGLLMLFRVDILLSAPVGGPLQLLDLGGDQLDDTVCHV